MEGGELRRGVGLKLGATPAAGGLNKFRDPGGGSGKGEPREITGGTVLRNSEFPLGVVLAGCLLLLEISLNIDWSIPPKEEGAVALQRFREGFDFSISLIDEGRADFVHAGGHFVNVFDLAKELTAYKVMADGQNS